MSEQLNVLLVVIGGARADHLSPYGYAEETTPFLDEVAQEGVRFTNMVTTEPHALGAHAALFTGLHSATHGATEETPFLAPRYRLLPEYLKAVGYRTAAFCTHPLVSPETGFGAGFDAFFTQRHHNRLAARAWLYGRKASDRLLRRDDSGARRTGQALRRWLASDEHPFFAFVHFNETHAPFRPPRPYDRMFLPKRTDLSRAWAVDQDWDGYLARHTAMSAEDISVVTALYNGELRYVDQQLRESVQFLRARGVWERTLFIVTAAHGDTLGGRGSAGHRLGMPDSLLRVPLVVRCPSRVPQGFVVEELAQTTDLLPTILQLLDISEDVGQTQGRALFTPTGVAAGPGATMSERFRSNLSAVQRRFPDVDVRPFDVRHKAIRTRREKFIWRSDEANEFYDLVLDPGETTNLIEARRERAESLRRQLFDWLAQVEKFDPEKAVLRNDALLPPQPGQHGMP